MRKPVDAICEQKDADQPEHPRSLIIAFVVRCLDSIIYMYLLNPKCQNSS